MFRRVILSLLLIVFSVPAFAADILVTVDISDQTMWVRVDGKLEYTFDVSTGRKGHSTPTGRWGVERMYKRYNSKKYDGAPMPYAMFFYEGFAIHGTTDLKHLGRIASHGCVRLHPDNAKALFGLVKQIGQENTVVRVRG